MGFSCSNSWDQTHNHIIIFSRVVSWPDDISPNHPHSKHRTFAKKWFDILTGSENFFKFCPIIFLSGYVGPTIIFFGSLWADKMSYRISPHCMSPDQTLLDFACSTSSPDMICSRIKLPQCHPSSILGVFFFQPCVLSNHKDPSSLAAKTTRQVDLVKRPMKKVTRGIPPPFFHYLNHGQHFLCSLLGHIFSSLSLTTTPEHHC